jgi:hypothetical protein
VTSATLLTLAARSGDLGVESGSAFTIFEYGLIGAYPLSPLLQASVAAGIYPAAVVRGSGQVYLVDSDSRASERRIE